MKRTSENEAWERPEEKLLVTAQKKLLKPRLQNKLILAFVSTALISIAISTYLVTKITAELTENQIEHQIREANDTVISMLDQYEEQALRALATVAEKPGFADALKNEKVPYVFTPPISGGSETPIGVWVPSGHPVLGTGTYLSQDNPPQTPVKTIMQAEINGIQTLLAGAVMPILDSERQYGVLAFGYVLGKSFAQDLEIMTGADIRIFFEKIPAGPSSIFFEGSSYTLPESATKQVEEIASLMLKHPGVELIVEGHTDSTGSEKANYRIGRKRAEAIKRALVDEGIDPQRIRTISFGETRPMVPETNESDLALNRRVELEFKSRDDPLVGAIEDLPMTSMIEHSVFVLMQRYYDRDALLKGEPYRAIYQPLVGYGGKALGLIFVGLPRKYTFEATVATWHYRTVILGLGFLLATVLGYTISRGISRPIRHLYRGVLAVADGDLDQQFAAETKDEIGDLGRAFNIMTRKLRQLKELEGEVQRRNRLAALGELSAGVAHEIRNPLGVIKNSAEMLRDRIQDDAKRRELSGYIIEEVERLNKVITDFLRFARPADPELDVIDINEVVDRTLAFLDVETQAAGITIHKILAPDLPPVLADPEQCHQMLLNLCMNAFQAMNGAGALTVETRPSSRMDTGHDGAIAFGDPSTPPSCMVDVIIGDTGEGIPQNLLPRIFDPFFSTKDTGSGLGLSMVHKIVDNHKGRIRADSVVGTGTTFTVSLPCAQQAESEG